MLKRIGQFIVEMCKTWGAVITGGFLIAIPVSWQLTGHNIPIKVGWAIIMSAIIVAAFQVWNRQVALTQTAQTGLTEANQALTNETRIHESAIADLKLQLENSRALNSPHLVFSVDSAMRAGTLCDIHITIENAGQFPTKIFQGEIRLESFSYPTIDSSISLNNMELAGKSKRTLTLEVKRVWLINEQDPTVKPAHLKAVAHYNLSPGSSTSKLADYVYLPNKRIFQPVF